MGRQAGYNDEFPRGSDPAEFVIAERRGDEVVRRASLWWRKHDGERRFLWVHLYDPHAAYDPPAAFRQRYRDRPYLGEVAATDASLGPLLEPFLEGREGPALVVVTADHGEALGDHGEQTHGLFAYEATLEVPLILWGAGIPAGADSRSARHVDLVPTVLDRLGLEAPRPLRGRSLLGAARTARGDVLRGAVDVPQPRLGAVAGSPPGRGQAHPAAHPRALPARAGPPGRAEPGGEAAGSGAAPCPAAAGRDAVDARGPQRRPGGGGAAAQPRLPGEQRDGQGESVKAYERWVREVCERTQNRPRAAALAEEKKHLRPLPPCRVPDYTVHRPSVRRWSTIRVGKRTYSVPSRLIGHRLEARLGPAELKVYYKGSLVERLAPLHGDADVRIDYRHVIWSLVRKPRAFARYRYREEPFPALAFRKAYDALVAWRSERAESSTYASSTWPRAR